MNRKQIGKNIQTRRKELRMTQADLAEEAQLSNIHISHIENGNVNMSIETLLSICNILKLTPNDILLGEYIEFSVDDILFREPSNQIKYDDKLMLQYLYRYLLDRNIK